MDAVFDEILVYKDILSESEINWLYRNQYSSGYRKNYWSQLKLVNPEFNPIQKIGTDKWEFNAQFREVL